MGGFFRPGDIVLLDCRKRVDGSRENDREALIMTVPEMTITSISMLELTCFVVSNSSGVLNKDVQRPRGNILILSDTRIVPPQTNWLTLVVLSQKRVREKRHQYEVEAELVGKMIAIEHGDGAREWFADPVSIIL